MAVYTTLSDMVLSVQQRVLSALQEENNYLGASISSTDTMISLQAGQTLGSIQSGKLIQVDYELMFVMGQPSGPGAIPVVRGFYDSVAVQHSAGAVVNVDPRFPAVDIIRAINEDIDDLSAPTNGLFQMLEVTTTFIPVQQGYDMSGLSNDQVMEVWEVRDYEYGPTQKFPISPPQAWKLQRNADTNLFPSGMSLTRDRGGFPGRPMRIQYKSPYSTPLVNATDNIGAVTGLQPTCRDIPVLGAPSRMMQYRELKRSFSEAQGEPRRAQEVPVGASLTASKGMMALRQSRIDAERSRLNIMYPRQSR